MKKVIKSAIALFIISLFIKVLGPLKHYLIADTFGLSRKLDAYFFSQNTIDTVIAGISFPIIILLVPIFTKELNKPNKAKLNSIDSFISQVIVISLIISIAMIGLSRAASNLIPGFSEISVQGDLAKFLTVNSAALVFLVPFAVFTGYFHSNDRVAFPSFLDSIKVFLGILFLLLFSNVLDIYSLPFGYFSGALL